MPHMVTLEDVLLTLAEKIQSSDINELPADLEKLEDELANAVRQDMAQLYSSVLNVLGSITPYGGCDGYRKVSFCSVFGYVDFKCAYYGPYSPKEIRQLKRKKARDATRGKSGTDRKKKNSVFIRTGGAPCSYPLYEKLSVQDGLSNTLSNIIQRVGVSSGSFKEGAEALRLILGIIMSPSTFRRKVLLAGNRALEAQEIPALRYLAAYLPAWLLACTTETQLTMYIMLDGTGVPCVKKDTKGIKGKKANGQAGTRELKVGIVGTYQRLNKHGRPVRDPGCESHIVTAKNAKGFGTLLRKLAISRGYGSKPFRVQIVGDGAEWIENIVKEAFPDKQIIFTNDFYHTCQYLYAFIEMAEPQAEQVQKIYNRTKAMMLRYGANTLVKHMKKRYSALPEQDDAWKKLKYIEDRSNNMKYHEYRKQGLFIGSGPVESACRTNVARRCKQAGMHWRLNNAAAMCALTARFRSNLPAV